MSLGGPRRIHIAPLGYEDERIYQPIIEEDADKAILLIHDQDESESLGAKCREKVETALDDENIDYELRECNIFDLKEALGEFQNLIYQHHADAVFVNISTGSKITAISGMLACMMAGGRPYYVKPEDYGESTVSQGVEETFTVSAYPIEPPNEETIKVLEFIKEENDRGNDVIISDLNKFVNDENLSLVRGIERQDSDNIYDLVRSNLIAPLSEREFIRVQRIGNEKRITLTEQGERVLDFSRFILEE
ncbi:DUF6293 family protein (plasmid) [Natrinema zhouii]|uniref:HFX_2341 family transcriptional regulator domain-containing protein n=1 Tax=Natrinema zhouii TaxID=1710539 RepID=UPI001D001446|nr:DUF6293 family protein [Natrinema zhouii]UHQ98910.1 DUF6293 family protein [Natrinema zhouii]